MEPYYVAALALYRVEYRFRNGTLAQHLKYARYQILMAMRILAVGYDMPAMTANKMESYCVQLIKTLVNPEQCQKLIDDAVDKVNLAAHGNFDTDTIRTEPFTEKVINLARELNVA